MHSKRFVFEIPILNSLKLKYRNLKVELQKYLMILNSINELRNQFYSHSIVAGGLLDIS